VMVDTMGFLGHYIQEGTRFSKFVDLLSMCEESRTMNIEKNDITEINKVPELREMSDDATFKKLNQGSKLSATIVRNRTLILAHLNAQHQLLTPRLRSQLDLILKFSNKITVAMIEVCLVKQYLTTAVSAIDFRRAIFQSVTPNRQYTHMLQIPGFSEDEIREVTKGRTLTLKEYIEKSPADRKYPESFTVAQRKDVDEFCNHLKRSILDVDVKVEVEDEQDIYQGDIGSILINISRPNLHDKEAVGPIYNYRFPSSSFEELWVIVTNTRTNGIISYERIRSREKTLEPVRLRFHCGQAGTYRYTVQVLNDSYFGMDFTKEVTFNVKNPQMIEYTVHPEDADLDKNPTLFMQMMGMENQDEYSDDSDDENAPIAGSPQNRIEPADDPISEDDD